MELAKQAEGRDDLGETGALVVGPTESVDPKLQSEALVREIFELKVSAQAQVHQLKSSVKTANAQIPKIEELNVLRESVRTAIDDVKGRTQIVIDESQAAITASAEGLERLEAIKSDVLSIAAEIAKKSEDIEKGRLHARDSSVTMDEFVLSAKNANSEVESRLDEVRESRREINSLHASAVVSAQKIDAIEDQMDELEKKCSSHVDATKGLAEKAEKIQVTIEAAETRLRDLHSDSRELTKRIEALLPGATSAGLANAFDQRGQSFRAQEKFWHNAFLASLGGLLALALWGAIVYAVPQAYSDLVRLLLFRVPLAVPLIWLALHTSRQASLAKRMEEEYAFKAAVSTAFEGYRKQMAEVGAEISDSSPLGRLCNDTLKTISSPPGRVYEKHRLDPTPATAAGDAVAPLVEGVAVALGTRVSGK